MPPVASPTFGLAQAAASALSAAAGTSDAPSSPCADSLESFVSVTAPVHTALPELDDEAPPVELYTSRHVPDLCLQGVLLVRLALQWRVRV
jgi:hypothetical protein